jgi:hypothetical protein
MEARSQLRHRPTRKLFLVYTSEGVDRASEEQTAKFCQRIILTEDDMNPKIVDGETRLGSKQS